MTGVLVLLGLLPALLLPTNHDIAWLLYVGRRVLDGAVPYMDLMEPNPPLIVYASVVVAWLARTTGAAAPVLYATMVALLAALSMLFSARLLSRSVPDGAASMLPALALALFPLAGLDFGQREHLMFAALLPYLAAAAWRAEGRGPVPGAAGIGILAGLGIALKPHFVLPWLLVEGYLALTGDARRSWRRPEAVAVVVVGSAYVASVPLVTPGYLPLMRWAADVYADFFPTTYAALLASPALWICAAAALVAFLRPVSDPLAHQRRLFALASVGFVVVVVVQKKGWSYHWYPALAAAWLVVGTLVTGATLRVAAPARLRVATWGLPLAASALLLLAAPGAERWADDPYYLPQMREIVREHAGGRPIASLTTRMEVGFPLVNEMGVEWGTRFHTLWPIPGLYADRHGASQPFPYRDRAEMGRLERAMVDGIAADLERSRPALLIVDRWGPGRELASFDYFEYFMRDARIAALLQEYRPLGRVGHYVVLKHVGASPTPTGTP